MLLYTNYSSSNTQSVIRIFRLYVTKIALHATFLIKNLYLLYYFWSKLPFYGIQEFIFLMTVCRGGQAPFLGSPPFLGNVLDPLAYQPYIYFCTMLMQRIPSQAGGCIWHIINSIKYREQLLPIYCM